jgi:hypothetical protein
MKVALTCEHHAPGTVGGDDDGFSGVFVRNADHRTSPAACAAFYAIDCTNIVRGSGVPDRRAAGRRRRAPHDRGPYRRTSGISSPTTSSARSDFFQNQNPPAPPLRM